MTRHRCFRSVLRLVPFLIFSLFPLQVSAQFDPATGFAVCSRGEYSGFIGDALANHGSTASIHRAWYGQCLGIHLTRAKYLDTYLEKAISEYLFWMSSVQQTGDEISLEAEDNRALDRLGKAFSDAVDRANEECEEKDDWKLMRRAIKWWGKAMELDLAREEFDLDEASFKERLCGKIYYDILEAEGRLGYYDYVIRYRIGVRLGKNEPRYDIPLNEEDPNVLGGRIIEDQIIDQQVLDGGKAELEATIAELEASGVNNEIAQGMIAMLKETLTEMNQAGASGIKKHRALTISPENNDSGLVITVPAAMQEIPLVAERYQRLVAQNPYRGSKWKFSIEATAIRLKLNPGSGVKEEKGNTKHSATGEFSILWETDSEGGAVLGRSWENYKDEMEFTDFGFSDRFGGCTEYKSQRFTLNGAPLAKKAWSVISPESPIAIVSRNPQAPYLVITPSDRSRIAMTYLNPFYLHPDERFEYFVPCLRTTPGGSPRPYVDKRSFGLGQLFQVALPLEDVNETREWQGEYERWTLQIRLNCLEYCPSQEALRPPQPPQPEAPEPEHEEEEDRCDPAWVQGQCETDLRATILQCSQYNDWQVSIDRPGSFGPEIFCSDLSCAGAIARGEENSPKDILKTITHATDASCSSGAQNVCSITCVGYQ